MIPYNNYRLTGIKKGDITSEIDSLINSASQFIIICGYSFTSDKTRDSTLSKVINSPVKNKHCILPIKLQIPYGKDVNRSIALRLINGGVSVSIEDLNHSKWIMTEKGIYYGSANFSKFSLTKRIEVVSFYDFNLNDPLQNDFVTFAIFSMRHMLYHSDRRKLHGVLVKNDILVRSAKSMIKRYNPSVEKVVATLDSIDEVRNLMVELLHNCYWYLGDNYYYKLSHQSQYYLKLLNSINYYGFEILGTKENNPMYKRQIEYYNKYCDEYTTYVENFALLANDYLMTDNLIPRYTTQNRKLATENLSIIKEKLSNIDTLES